MLSVRRKTFQPYCEPFRPLNQIEIQSIHRASNCPLPEREMIPLDWKQISKEGILDFSVSYQSHLGGFTICNILLNGKIYSGSSCCSKFDAWLPIRGKMLAFRRALESEGVVV